MATKPKLVNVEARRLDVSIVPLNFGIPLTDYFVNQSDDIASVAGQANEAANGAYIAQLTNEEQNIVLADHSETLLNHENRIDDAELKIEDHEGRIVTLEAASQDHENRINDLEISSADHETRIGDIETNYVSKAVSSLQELSGPLEAKVSYSINGGKVVGARQTGWTAAGGSVAANIGAWNPNTLAAASAAYVQSEATAVRQQLNAAEARLKAVESAMRTHGLIN